MKKKISFLLICLSIFATLTQAQTYEIRAVNKGNGVVGVEMKVTSGTPPTTGNAITDLVFGLKWQSSYNVDLLPAITTNYNIKKSDVRKLKGAFHYQAFFADNIPYSFPSDWASNSWVEIMSVATTRNSAVDTGTFAITEPGFDITTDPNIGMNLVDRTPIINGFAAGVLIRGVMPVNLLKFEASSKGNYIQLEWSTATEINNKGFEIQRSVTNTMNFERIGWMDGKGNSTSVNEYSFRDNNVVAGVLYYYRLNQTDYDGRSTFSSVKSAKLQEFTNNAFRISPNPATTVLNVTVLNSITGRIKLKIVDAKGVVVREIINTFSPGGKIDINVTFLVAGQYYLIIEQNNDIIYQNTFQKG